jgi:hypothetical protein
MEASGTSGMKASLNGVLNLSILDGWWIEGYNGRNGWAFGNEMVASERRDHTDASAIYDLIEKEIVPLYYDRSIDDVPHGWVKMMKESIKSNGPRFSARRMVKEYVARYYPSLLKGAGVEYTRAPAAAKPRTPAWKPRAQGKTGKEATEGRSFTSAPVGSGESVFAGPHPALPEGPAHCAETFRRPVPRASGSQRLQPGDPSPHAAPGLLSARRVAGSRGKPPRGPGPHAVRARRSSPRASGSLRLRMRDRVPPPLLLSSHTTDPRATQQQRMHLP